MEGEGGDAEHEVEGEVGPAAVLGTVQQHQVGGQEGETQADVNIPAPILSASAVLVLPYYFR